jgi:N-acetylmuramoyl-L-alanine amidase
MTRLIVLDPGHGGSDPGAVGSGLQEKNINLELVRRVQRKMADTADVILTRNSDVFLSLADRADRANKQNADLFVSLHVNAGGGTGFESYIHPAASAASVEMQNRIHHEVAGYYARFGLRDRGKKRANFAVLRLTEMPAVLLENLFIDNKTDADKLKDPAFLDGLAESVSNGILKALGEQPGPQPDPGPQPEPLPHWAQKDFERLRQAGLVTAGHDLDSSVTWGELSAVVARLLDKLGQ